MSDELLYTILQRIRTQGPMRFDEFMNLALYSEPHGYYRSHVPGADSDYHTSATLTPWFGRLVCRRLRQMWEELGSPDEFTVAELGGGSGDMAAAALDAAAADPDFAAALRWAFIEPMPAIADLQASRLGSRTEIRWVGAVEELAPLVGVVIANEVLDNFPFRVFEIGEYGPMEVCVDVPRDSLIETLQTVDATDPALLRPAEQLETGDRFEVSTGIGQWAAAAAGALDEGFLVIIDYGDTEPDLWTLRPAGSMVTYRRGKLGLDPFEHLGQTDITAHVNFTDLARRLTDAGFGVQRPVSQRSWLNILGLKDVVADLREQELAARESERHSDLMRILAERSKLHMLASGTLGDYLVLEAKKA